jgi:hypothetical protein
MFLTLSFITGQFSLILKLTMQSRSTKRKFAVLHRERKLISNSAQTKS